MDLTTIPPAAPPRDVLSSIRSLAPPKRELIG